MEKLGTKCKQLMIEEIKKQISDSEHMFISSFNKIPVTEQDQLRRQLKEMDASLLVVKNRLAKQVFKQLKKDDLGSVLKGITVISLGGADSLAVSKTLVKFAEKQENFEILAGYVDEQVLDSNSVKRLAAIPSREILLSQIVGGIKSPIQGFVNSLSGTIKKFVLVVDRISEAQAYGAKRT